MGPFLPVYISLLMLTCSPFCNFILAISVNDINIQQCTTKCKYAIICHKCMYMCTLISIIILLGQNEVVTLKKENNQLVNIPRIFEMVNKITINCLI
jgi:hypothetical protein